MISGMLPKFIWIYSGCAIPRGVEVEVGNVHCHDLAVLVDTALLNSTFAASISAVGVATLLGKSVAFFLFWPFCEVEVAVSDILLLSSWYVLLFNDFDGVYLPIALDV